MTVCAVDRLLPSS